MIFYLTTAGLVIPSVTGSISCISSLAIIYIKVRSKTNTTYHRIMFLMSFCDMLASLAIALTTIPMPKDVIYPFKGRSYGNTATCVAQGLVYITGSAIVVGMNSILNVYYLWLYTTIQDEGRDIQQIHRAYPHLSYGNRPPSGYYYDTSESRTHQPDP